MNPYRPAAMPARTGPRQGGQSGTALAAALLATLLAGCAQNPAPPTAAAAPAPAPREARPASDGGNPERRAQLRLELAAAYFSRGQSSTALEEIQQAISARPDFGPAFGLRGLILASLGDNARADESFRRALQLDPRDADTLHNYGWFQCQLGRFAEAERNFEAALAQPQYIAAVRTWFALGVCQARAGRLVDAERSLSRSYELDPASAVTAYNLADVLLRRGDASRARFYINRVNGNPEASNAQSLWLAARIEKRLGNDAAAQALGRQLRDRFPQSPETLQFERGRFDDV